jgi:hypothetical protein
VVTEQNKKKDDCNVNMKNMLGQAQTFDIFYFDPKIYCICCSIPEFREKRESL